MTLGVKDIIEGKISNATNADTVPWGGVSGKPSTYPPSSHTHSNYLTTGGTAAAATKLATARSISIVGDSLGSASFDGTSNISIDTVVFQHSTADIPANADLNSYTHPGWYMCALNDDVKTLSNRPGNNAFAMVVLSGAGITQIVFEYMTSGYKIYTRNKHGTTWGSWGRVYTTENKPTYSEIFGSDVGTVAVQSSEPSDPNVKLWIQI